MSRPGMLIASILAVGLIGLGIYQFMPEGESADPAAEGGDNGGATGQSANFQAPAAGSVSVTAEAVHRGDLVKRITANGVGEAERLVTVGAEVEGKIRSLPVVEGQWVSAGDVLVELDDTELLLERDRSAEAYIYNLMNFAQDQIVVPGDSGAVVNRAGEGENALEFLRSFINDEAYNTMLLQPGLEERLSKLSREDLFAARAQLTAQRVALERAELDLQRARITAPFSGQVAGLEASSGPNNKSWPVVGQDVGTGTDLMLLVDPDPIRVRVEVIESEISFVREGRRAEVTFPAYPGEIFNGTIEAIDPVVDADRKTLSVTVRLPNGDRRLKPGMFAQVVLDTEIFQDRLLVPVEAVLLRDNRQLVFVVRDGRAQWVYVSTGLENEEWIEVHSEELEEGDVVITSGHFTLAHDVPVNVIEPEETGDDS